MARKYTLGFSQLYFDCSTDIAKKLNNSRRSDCQVPDDVITKMAAKMEQPNPFNNKWEAFSFTVKVDVDKVKDVAIKEDVKSMPTFVCYRR